MGVDAQFQPSGAGFYGSAPLGDWANSVALLFFQPQLLIYVVGNEQQLHFKQVFKVLELLGKPWAKDMYHIPFGMVSLEDGAMSTRKGKVVLLKDVLNKAVEKSLGIITEKNPNLENKGMLPCTVFGTFTTSSNYPHRFLQAPYVRFLLFYNRHTVLTTACPI